MARRTFRRVAGVLGLLALVLLLIVGMAEASCGDCSEHAAMSAGMVMGDTAGAQEGHPHCCEPPASGEDAGRAGSAPEPPACSHSVGATACSASGSLPAPPIGFWDTTLPNVPPLSATFEAPASASGLPPFQPPRI